MVPLALLVSSLILLAIGIRGDSGILGPLLTWGASAAQFTLAIVLVWVAAHESTPAGQVAERDCLLGRRGGVVRGRSHHCFHALD